MYQALYRKWRPKAFSDVVGQGHITETLRRQVEQGRLSHAYLFTGTRGTGKTTCAKILAKAVNCQHPVNGDPCNQCPACLGIDSGSILDVLELDAASNNGVDSVRALRDEAIYSPAAVRYRVYIVDEVHMLSTPAFNALLKILEEPPEHLIFILATTELQKVPATILSRCQRFSFKRIQPADIAARLQYVAAQEGLSLRQDAAELLSRLSDGALRDALSLLDQCAGSGGEIGVERVLDVLGLAGSGQTVCLMDCVLRRDVPAALVQLDQLYRSGKDVGALLGELAALNRDMLIRMIAPEGGAALLSGGYDPAAMDSLSRGVSPNRLIHIATQLQNACAALPLSTNRRTDAELCLMKLCDETLCGDTAAVCARLDRLEAGNIPLPSAPAAPARPSSALSDHGSPGPEAVRAAPSSAADAPPWDDPAPVAADTPPDDRTASPAPDPAPMPEIEKPAAPAAKSSGVWKQLMEEYKNQLMPMYWYFLDDASGKLEGDVLTVYCGDDFTLENLDCSEVRRVLEQVTAAHTGGSISVRFTVGKTEGEAPDPADKLDDLIKLGSKLDNFTVK